jgi:hypothetical protein
MANVKIGRLPSRRQDDTTPTTPFDMLNVSVGGTTIQARPFETSHDATTGKEYPSKAVTSCPHCGHGITFSIGQHQLLAAVPIELACDNCQAGVVAPQLPLQDPFRNPLVDGVIARSELDPLYDVRSIPSADTTTTAAERIKKRHKKPAPTPLASHGPTIIPLPPDDDVPPGPPGAPREPISTTLAGEPPAVSSGQETATACHDDMVPPCDPANDPAELDGVLGEVNILDYPDEESTDTSVSEGHE